MSTETTAYSFPFDFTRQHTVHGAIRHTDGRTSIDCQCGRGCTGLTERDATTRWAAHMAEVQD